MLILDAIAACIIIKFFDDKAILILGVMLALSLLRLCYSSDKIFNYFHNITDWIDQEED